MFIGDFAHDGTGGYADNYRMTLLGSSLAILDSLFLCSFNEEHAVHHTTRNKSALTQYNFFDLYSPETMIALLIDCCQVGGGGRIRIRGRNRLGMEALAPFG